MDPPRFEAYAVLVADMVGYSGWLAAQPAATHTAYTKHLQTIFDPSVRNRGGRIVKTTGDGFLAIFKDAVSAEACGRQIQIQIQQERVRSVEPASLMEYRIAAHLGSIAVESHDVFGLAVNTAIHMQSIASPNGICISDTVYSCLPDTTKELYSYIGQKTLKNLPTPVSVFHHVDKTNRADHLRAVDQSLIIRRAFLNPPPRLGAANLTTMIDETHQRTVARIVQDALFQGLSRFRDILITVPIAESIFGHSISTHAERVLLFKELNLDYVMHGSFLIHSDRASVTIYLEDARRGELLWVNTVQTTCDPSEINQVVADEFVAPVAFYLQRNEMDLQRQDWGSEDERRFKVAQRLLKQGTLASTDRARQMLAGILSRCGDIGDVHVALARAEHLHGRLLAGQEFVDALERARHHAVLAIEIDDLNAQAHSELALQELFLKRQTTAAQIYQHALRLNPYDPMLQADWADCLTFMGRAQEALPMLERAASSWPKDRNWVSWNLCDTLWALEQPDRIIEILDDRTELPHVHRYLAAANAKLGRTTEARRHAEKVRTYQPSFSTKEWRQVVPYTNNDSSAEYAEFLARAGL